MGKQVSSVLRGHLNSHIGVIGVFGGAEVEIELLSAKFEYPALVDGGAVGCVTASWANGKLPCKDAGDPAFQVPKSDTIG